MPPSFTGLPDEIILRVVCFCTVRDFFALRRTSKPLNNFLARPIRSIWLHLLQELDDFRAPDLPPHVSLDSLSSRELESLVMRAVKGYSNWNTSSKSGPRAARRRVIDLKDTSDLLGFMGSGFGWNRNFKLLPGGKFLCIPWRSGHLQCWDVEKGEAIWTYPEIDLQTLHQDDIQIVAYDAEYDSSARQIFIVVLKFPSVQQTDIFTLQTFWLDPCTKRATKVSERGYSHSGSAISLRIYEDVIVFFGASYTVISKTLEKHFVMRVRGRILPDTVSVSNGYLIFVGNRNTEDTSTLYAVGLERMFTLSESDILWYLEECKLKVPLTVYPDYLDYVHIMLGRATQNLSGNMNMRIYVIGKLCSSEDSSGREQKNSTDFALYSFQLHLLTSSDPPSADTSRSSSSLTLLQSKVPISIKLPHPRCTELVHTLSHSGRGLLESRRGQRHTPEVRYYAFSFEELINGRVPEFLGSIAFGPAMARAYLAPSDVYMEKYSGALVYATIDDRSVVIQYYD